MKIIFNEFCHDNCDRLYEPRLPEHCQSTGYLQLKKMVKEGITPASLEEIERWEKNPTLQELLSEPDIKYLRFLHPNLRPFIIVHWNNIKEMKIEEPSCISEN